MNKLEKALAEVMEEDYVYIWLHTPNCALDGLAPIEVDESLIWGMIRTIETGEL